MSSNIKYQGNKLGESSRGGGRFQGTRARGLVSYGCRFGRSRGAHLSSYHSSEEEDQTNLDDSTQPPSQPWVPPCANPVPPPDPIREPSPVREQSPPREVATNEDLCIPQTATDAPTEPVANQQ